MACGFAGGHASCRQPHGFERKVTGKREDGERELGTLIIAGATSLSPDRPGNGGLRLWNYQSKEAADQEAHNLAVGMEVKHATVP